VVCHQSCPGNSHAKPFFFHQGLSCSLNSDRGKPPFKASDGDRLTLFMSLEDFVFVETRFPKGMGLLFIIKVRPEAFPNGSPLSSLFVFCSMEVYPRFSMA